MKKLVEKLKVFFGKVRFSFEGFGDCLRTWRRDFHNWFLDHVSTMKTLCVGICIGLLISLKAVVKYMCFTQYDAIKEYVAFTNTGV